MTRANRRSVQQSLTSPSSRRIAAIGVAGAPSGVLDEQFAQVGVAALGK